MSLMTLVIFCLLCLKYPLKVHIGDDLLEVVTTVTTRYCVKQLQSVALTGSPKEKINKIITQTRRAYILSLNI